MRHCTRCRADAVGLLDSDRTDEMRGYSDDLRPIAQAGRNRSPLRRGCDPGGSDLASLNLLQIKSLSPQLCLEMETSQGVLLLLQSDSDTQSLQKGLQHLKTTRYQVVGIGSCSRKPLIRL